MSKPNAKDKIIKTQTEKITNEQGDIKKETLTQTVVVESEPSYVKLYLNTLLAFKDLPKQMSPVLLEILNHMTFANSDAEHGGQLIILNSFAKKNIAKRLGIKVNTIDHALSKLSKSGVLKRLALGTYQANPHMFGRGEWLDIKSIRATFDFNERTVEADIEANDEAALLTLKNLFREL